MLLDKNYTHITGTAAGTTVILAHDGWFDSVLIPSVSTGTVTFYDTATAGGSAASNAIMGPVSNLLNGTAVAATPYRFEVGTRVRYGLVAVVGGTVDFTVVHG